MKVRTLLLPALVLSALIASCASPTTNQAEPTPTPRPPQPALERPTYTVQRGTVVDELELSGRVAAVRQEDLAFTTDGYLQTVYVDRTDQVTEGQLLAELDLGDLPNQLRQAEVTYEQATLELDRIRQQREFAVRRAQLDVEDARAQLAEVQKPPDAQEVTQARAALAQAVANLEQVRNNASAEKTQAEEALTQASQALVQAQTRYSEAYQYWQRVKDVKNADLRQSAFNDFTRAEADLRSAESAVEQAKIRLDTARQNEGPAVARAEAQVADAQARLDDLLQGAEPEEVAAAQRAVQRAELALEEAQQLASTDPELERRLASAQLDIERIQEQIDARRLYAPFDSEVGAIGAVPGDQISAYEPVISVQDPSELEVIVVGGVTGDNAARIGVGMPVEIVFSRYPGRTFQGTITQLPTSATTSGSRIEEDPAYHIDYGDEDLELQIGDLARVLVTLERKDDTLWLPPQAVRAFESRRFVVVQEGDRQRRVDVRVGIVSAERVEILEGLEEGDVVVGQ